MKEFLEFNFSNVSQIEQTRIPSTQARKIHLDEVRGLKSFHPVCQEEELVGAMLLRLSRTSRSS